MARDKRSFFERLTGTVSVDEYDDFEDTFEEEAPRTRRVRSESEDNTLPAEERAEEAPVEEEEDGQLSVDVYQTADDIVIRAVVAGVKPDELDVSITRDMVTIRGSREEAREVEDDDYYHAELYWGSFSRTILLPAEVEVEEAEAQEKHGMLTMRLPKIDKDKQTKLKVKGN